jgi:hypothetical protein
MNRDLDKMRRRPFFFPLVSQGANLGHQFSRARVKVAGGWALGVEAREHAFLTNR